MTEVREAERALGEHGAFERDGETFVVTTTPIEARVYLADAGSAVGYRVTVRAPTLDAAVAGEDVAPVVQEGWFETFERRMEDVGAATRVDPEPPAVSMEGEEIVVESRFQTGTAVRGADDAKAIVDYVEGTYMEGIIPGYDYREPVAGMVARAQENAQDAGDPV